MHRHKCDTQAVEVSLEPVEAGGLVKLNLAALEHSVAGPSHGLPAVRTSITSVTSVSPRRTSRPISPVASEIQPALPESHQVSMKSRSTQNHDQL